jgi:hypothetical protein
VVEIVRVVPKVKVGVRLDMSISLGPWKLGRVGPLIVSLRGKGLRNPSRVLVKASQRRAAVKRHR